MQRDDVGLRDRLARLDRQRRVLVGELLQALAQKLLARHAAHGGQDPGIPDAARRHLFRDHPFPEFVELVDRLSHCDPQCTGSRGRGLKVL